MATPSIALMRCGSVLVRLIQFACAPRTSRLLATSSNEIDFVIAKLTAAAAAADCLLRC